MKHLFAFVLMLGALTMSARELPVTTIGGRQCYVYDVAKRENIYDVSRTLGVSTAQIVRFNPSAADGLRQGMRLFIPCSIVENEAIKPARVDGPDAPRAATPSPSVSRGTAVQPDSAPATPAPSPVTYTVGKGESLYGISRKFNITMERIVELNPAARYGVRQGDILVLDPSTPVEADSAPLQAVTGDDPIPAPEVAAPAVVAGQAPDLSLVIADEPLSRDTLNMAVMLPFMSHEADPGKNSRLFVEFYRGLLLAAHDLRNNPGNHVNIYAYDTSASDDSVRAIMRRPEMADMNIIIAPDNEAHLQLIADDMMSNTLLYNTFNVRSDLYLTNPRVIQANIPHTPMLAKAVDAFVEMYGDYTPVFLSRIDGPADKDVFTSRLRQRLDSLAIPYRNITYKNLLSHRDLDTMSTDLNYVFVPVSGARAEFAKFSEAIRQFGQSRPDRSIRLFGYPDWIIFRGEYFNRLCELEATIYTRFYADMQAIDTRLMARDFEAAYGEEMLDAAPVQGILGYDTGRYLISLLQEYGTGFTDRFTPYAGLQSVMNFVSSPGGGDVNDSLLIVTFTPDGSTLKTALE